MKILVLGASGGVGRHIVRIASARGHQVTAVVRAKLDVPSGVRLVIDDVAREGCLDAVVAGHDAVLSSLGMKRTSPNPWSALASPLDFSSATARALTAAMKKHGVRRVIAVSAAGVGDSRPGLNLPMRVLLATSKIGPMYADLERMERVYAESGLDHCCVRPTTLTDGPETGRWKTIPDFPTTARISRADVARWLVEQVDAEVIAERTPTITGAA